MAAAGGECACLVAFSMSIMILKNERWMGVCILSTSGLLAYLSSRKTSSNFWKSCSRIWTGMALAILIKQRFFLAFKYFFGIENRRRSSYDGHAKRSARPEVDREGTPSALGWPEGLLRSHDALRMTMWSSCSAESVVLRIREWPRILCNAELQWLLHYKREFQFI